MDTANPDGSDNPFSLFVQEKLVRPAVSFASAKVQLQACASGIGRRDLTAGQTACSWQLITPQRWAYKEDLADTT